MTIFGKLFGPPKPRDPAAAERIKLWVRTELRQNPDLSLPEGSPIMPDAVAVTVSEIDCNDPSCPGTETVILIMLPYKTTRAIKVSKTMDRVVEADVIDVMRGS